MMHSSKQNQGNKMSYIKQLNEVLDSPCYSYAMKAALQAFDRRDCVDAVRDAELLASLCRLRVSDVQSQATIVAG